LETSCSTQLLLHLPLRNQLSGRVELETGTKKTTQSPFQFDRRHAEAILAKNGPGDSETPNDEATDGGPQESESSGKPFEVVASYATRGEESILSLRRLHWIAFRNGLEFALLVGFGHIYVYDNCGSQCDHPTLNLKGATDRFAGKVDRIPWDYVVCNNHQPGARTSPGERSSQYAAENCMPHTVWQLDHMDGLL
jgi:hypothetical protein